MAVLKKGSMAIFVGLLVWTVLPPAPDRLKPKTWMFSPEEVIMAQQRSSSKLQNCRMSDHRTLTPLCSAYNTQESRVQCMQILTTVKDPKSWALASMNCGISLGVSSIGLFLPTFIKALGFSGGESTSVLPSHVSDPTFRADSAVQRDSLRLRFLRCSPLPLIRPTQYQRTIPSGYDPGIMHRIHRASVQSLRGSQDCCRVHRNKRSVPVSDLSTGLDCLQHGRIHQASHLVGHGGDIRPVLRCVGVARLYDSTEVHQRPFNRSGAFTVCRCGLRATHVVDVACELSQDRPVGAM